jgi:hypothetical protein
LLDDVPPAVATNKDVVPLPLPDTGEGVGGNA